MAEMVDAHDSGSCDLLVQVQVLFGAPLNKAPVAELVIIVRRTNGGIGRRARLRGV